MKLIVGLGNPGVEYEKTRHNMGFMLLDRLAEDVGPVTFKEGFKGTYAKGTLKGESFYMLKPLTYMNLSGESVQEFASYFKIPTDEIVVLVDDMALEPGRFRIRANGSSGGQKGLQNVIDLLHTDQIKRIRIGTGEPVHKHDIDYVLTVPPKEEMSLIDAALDEALMALKYYIVTSDFTKTMSLFSTNKIQGK